MPPKGLSLALAVPDDGDSHAPGIDQSDGPTRTSLCVSTPVACCTGMSYAALTRVTCPQDSWKVNANGAVEMLSKSYNPYQFSSEGLIKANGNQHYKVNTERVRAKHAQRSCRYNAMCVLVQISEQDIVMIKTVGRGASSTVSIFATVSSCLVGQCGRLISPCNTGPMQVVKGFLHRENRFVAIKKINIFSKVGVGA